MLDSTLRSYIAPSLDKVAEKVETMGIHTNLITLGALGIGLIGCFFVAIHSYIFGLIVLLASRLVDGIAGAIAQRQGKTEFGTFLSALCNTIFYAAFVFFFVITTPPHMPAGMFLLFSGIGTAASLFAFRLMESKSAVTFEPTAASMTARLVEKSEAMIFIVLTCLFPLFFSAIAFLFSILCWVTTFGRVMQGWYLFGQNSAHAQADYGDNPSV